MPSGRLKHLSHPGPLERTLPAVLRAILNPYGAKSHRTHGPIQLDAWTLQIRTFASSVRLSRVKNASAFHPDIHLAGDPPLRFDSVMARLVPLQPWLQLGSRETPARIVRRGRPYGATAYTADSRAPRCWPGVVHTRLRTHTENPESHNLIISITRLYVKKTFKNEISKTFCVTRGSPWTVFSSGAGQCQSNSAVCCCHKME